MTNPMRSFSTSLNTTSSSIPPKSRSKRNLLRTRSNPSVREYIAHTTILAIRSTSSNFSKPTTLLDLTLKKMQMTKLLGAKAMSLVKRPSWHLLKKKTPQWSSLMLYQRLRIHLLTHREFQSTRLLPQIEYNCRTAWPTTMKLLIPEI